MSAKTIPFSFEGITTRISILELDDKVYLDAYALWALAGKDLSKNLNAYLCLDTTKAFMLEAHFMSLGVDIHEKEKREELLTAVGELGFSFTHAQQLPFRTSESQIQAGTALIDIQDTTAALSNPRLSDEIRMFLSDFQTKRLSNEIEKLFVVSVDDAPDLMFFESRLFMDYAMFLSAHLKLHMLSIFQNYAWIEGLHGVDKIEAILEKASDALGEHHVDSTNNEVDRDEVDSRLLLTMKKKTLREKLEELLPPMFYTGDSFFDDVENILDSTVYVYLFKQSKDQILSQIDIDDPYLDTPHLFFGKDALDILNSLESEILFYVCQNINAGLTVDKKRLQDEIKACSEALSQKMFRFAEQICLLDYVNSNGKQARVYLTKSYALKKV